MTGDVHPIAPWLKRFAGQHSSRPVLVFPHAGGAASAYRALGAALAAAGADAYVMQYPQRGDRLTHPAPAGVPELADDLFAAANWAELAPLRLFGHCMGAVVAFEFARVAERRGVAVDALWASASEAPSTVAARPDLPTAQADILAELADLGGTDARLLADDDFVDLLLPAVRADYAAFNRYSCDAGVTVAADIHTLGGDDDHRVDEHMLRRWQPHTTGAFTVSTFPGGHFYVNDHLADIAELVHEL
ncbi:alpha/beta fold hydrolase [Mycobacterium sp. MYCO198283]|uniref:thioesterase II family protein n=1 Tax=Mycobacterium sp. MYCO198283 TaxID=2883505 RepID=UPI001E40B486|nr:alpha/beta fold hydrolase [Mycobacterium sp. MYCO198283]MCG5432538.1 alpha/beta fold hydrolase [Mycobacterium sp. MYCO198283]